MVSRELNGGVVEEKGRAGGEVCNWVVEAEVGAGGVFVNTSYNHINS